MEELLKNIQIKVNEKTYLKNPESSDLGRRIVENSISLINEIGFEAFTFKKLGGLIKSNESSVYRYFENKHKLLLYLASWYWAWIEYHIVIKTYSMSDPIEKLKQIILLITRTVESDSNFSHIDEIKLNKIVINEYSKSFLTKEVDKDNKEGYFSIYKRLITRVKDAINGVDSEYEFATTLASTIVEGSLHQHFLREHFPTITDCNDKIEPTNFYTNLVFNLLNKNI